jgi:hypothetical protein
VAEDYGLTLSPVFVENRGSVFGRNGAHLRSPSWL